MRELKFRVWDLQRKYFSSEYDIYCSNGSVSSNGSGIVDPNGHHFIPQQYTGLKDKNGKEIYEGDILRQNDLRFEIRFESFQWVAVCPYYNKYHHPRIEHFRLCASGEVIGNIMENPELLKA